jgi:ABC-2 type transport system permease protein
VIDAPAQEGRLSVLLGEAVKLPAFARRDMIVAWSYRFAFFSDALSLVLQAFLFYFVGLLVDDSKLPEYGGSQVSYMEFVAVGIALAAFVQIGLGRISAAMRQEQMIGTLEAILLTPTSPATIQLGSVVYDLISAAGTITFRGGSAGVGFAVAIMTLASGAYFPLDLLPGWLSTLAVLNPMAIAIEGMREPLLGTVSWSQTVDAVLVLVPLALVSLLAGVFAFRQALRRERRLGTLGLY